MPDMLPESMREWGWVIFGITVVILLAVDLLLHRGGKGTSKKGAYIWSAVWIGAGLLFTAVVYAVFGTQRAEEYVAAYLMEKSLSLDNLADLREVAAHLPAGVGGDNRRHHRGLHLRQPPADQEACPSGRVEQVVFQPDARRP